MPKLAGNLHGTTAAEKLLLLSSPFVVVCSIASLIFEAYGFPVESVGRFGAILVPILAIQDGMIVGFAIFLCRDKPLRMKVHLVVVMTLLIGVCSWLQALLGSSAYNYRRFGISRDCLECAIAQIRGTDKHICSNLDVVFNPEVRDYFSKPSNSQSVIINDMDVGVVEAELMTNEGSVVKILISFEGAFSCTIAMR